MKTLLLTASLVTLFSVGCTRNAVVPNVAGSDDAKPTAAEVSEAKAADEEALDVLLPDGDAPEAAASALRFRSVGDYFVYRFHGAYRETPVELTQRIVERDGKTMIIDMKLVDGDEVKELRLRFSDEDATRGKLLSVAQVIDGVQKPYGIDAYERLMTATVLSADDNLETLGSRTLKMDIGEHKLAVTKHAFKVKVGNMDAVMYTLASDEFPWGDVGGEIRADDGTLLYKAEIVDIGNDGSQQVAVQGEPESYDDYDDFED